MTRDDFDAKPDKLVSFARTPEQVNIVEIVPAKTDKDLATEYRQRLAQLILPVLALLDEAIQNGMTINFGVGQDAFGKMKITALQIIKLL